MVALPFSKASIQILRWKEGLSLEVGHIVFFYLSSGGVSPMIAEPTTRATSQLRMQYAKKKLVSVDNHLCYGNIITI